MPNREVHSFGEFQQLLWRIIGVLARSGYVAQPADAQDLVHDFYLEEWKSLNERYDASLGPFASYLYIAFYRFARRRIVQLASWVNRTVDVSTAIGLVDAAPPLEESLDKHAQWEALLQAMPAISSEDREFLRAFLEEAEGNERALARMRGVSRYRIGQKLQSIYKVLGEGIDLAKVANMTKKNVSSEPRQAPLILLKQALLSDRDASLLSEVTVRAAEIIAALEQPDQDFSPDELRQIESDPQWLAEIYEAIGGADDKGDEHSLAVADAIEKLHADEEGEIAAAFSLLLQSLPPYLTDWEQCFKGAARISEETCARLRSQWSIRADESADGLLAYGITPGAVFDATEGLSLLVDRLMDAAGDRSRVRVEFTAHTGDAVSATYAQFRAAVRATPGVPENAAEPLLAWLGEVASRRPYLFAGYRVVGWSQESFELVRDRSHSDAELMQRWTAFEKPEFRDQRYAPGAHEVHCPAV